MSPVPVHAAARELGCSATTLRRWVRAGAPVARRGRRGRGCTTLVDPAAVSAWRKAQAGEEALRRLAGEMPELLADAMEEAFRLVEGPTKRQSAGVIAGCWYMATSTILDRMREEIPDLPEVNSTPDKITKLRSIFEHSDTVGGNETWRQSHGLDDERDNSPRQSST